MGYDIWAGDKDTYNTDDEIYFRISMGGFRVIAEEGYDWFKLIGAEECDGGVSGTGEDKKIGIRKIEKACASLITHLIDGCYEADAIEYDLLAFMEKCIKWCEKNNKRRIPIHFG